MVKGQGSVVVVVVSTPRRERWMLLVDMMNAMMGLQHTHSTRTSQHAYLDNDARAGRAPRGQHHCRVLLAPFPLLMIIIIIMICVDSADDD